MHACTYIWLALAAVLAIAIFAACRSIRKTTEAEKDPKRERTGLGWVMACMMGLAVALGCAVYFAKPDEVEDEVRTAGLIVFAIVWFMALLFLMAAGFSRMGLADNKQALGLPEGSVRSMIALMLIMVFIIFGIYLFNRTGSGFWIRLPDSVGKPNFNTAPYKTFDHLSYEKGTDNIYKVWALQQASEDGKKLAQQLVTTIGTLVVAVSSFYFGSATATSAAKKDGGAATPDPVVGNVTPNQGRSGDTMKVDINGSGFDSVRSAKFTKSGKVIEAKIDGATSSVIHCTLQTQQKDETGKETNAEVGKWDVVVEN